MGGGRAVKFRLWRRSEGRAGEWYYCIRHGTVEEGPDCPARDRLGPYSTRREAANALETAKTRNQVWENDPNWNDRGRR
ncbi:hypothetical protein [Streptomyces scabrisporus]|uniref:hypothetical protein n=1 Tax=Embleya scabrispora TaxID=159449 RepID=UPI000367195E